MAFMALAVWPAAGDVCRRLVPATSKNVSGREKESRLIPILFVGQFASTARPTAYVVENDTRMQCRSSHPGIQHESSYSRRAWRCHHQCVCRRRDDIGSTASAGGDRHRYEPPAGQFVAYQLRLLRAARAFLDPMFNLGMITRQRAHDVLVQDVGLSEGLSREELDRYTAESPGQATA